MKKAKPAAKPQAAKPKAKYKAAPATARFTAELQAGKGNSSTAAWAFLSLPKSISAKLSSDTETTLEGAINNIPFRSTATAGANADSGANTMLKVGKTIHDFTKANIGDKVSVEITKIGDESETRMPAELTKALASTSPANKKAKALWDDITPIARRDWIFWIITGKLEETRMKRTLTAISKLSSGMRRACCFPGINWLMKNGK